MKVDKIVLDDPLSEVVVIYKLSKENEPLNYKKVYKTKAQFLKDALYEALNYNEKDKLLLAIEYGFVELLEAENRIALWSVIKGDNTRLGKTAERKKKKDLLYKSVWCRVSYFEGQGVKKTDAYNLVSDEYHKGYDSIHAYYGKLNKELCVDDSLNLFKSGNQIFGRIDKVKEIVNAEILKGSTEADGIIEASVYLNISEEECRYIWKTKAPIL